MKAFKGDAQLKSALLEQLKWHREQDMVLKGTYGECGAEYFKGCAIGCSIHSLARIRGERLNTADHRILEEYLDIPYTLARLEDAFFERLPLEQSLDLPYRFAEAIPVGADLSMVVPRFLYWLLTDETDGVIRFADETRFPRVRAAIKAVAALYVRWLAGEQVPRQLWLDARRGAYATTATAAAYAYAYAYADAYATAAAAAAAAAYATAAATAAVRTVWQERYEQTLVRQSEQLLELLKAAPIGA